MPCVIVSRIRRTTAAGLFLMEAFALYLSFLGAAWKGDAMAFLHEPWGLLRLAIPTVVALVALMLGDAYSNPGKRSPLKPFLQATLGVGFAALSQAALWTADRELVLPRWIMISGGGLSVLLISTLRTLFPPSDQRPRGAT